MRSERRVSIVIPCRNEAGPVQRLLDSLLLQDAPVHEVIVVDNASTDNLAGAVADWKRDHPEAPVRLVACLSIGAPAALNAGIRAAEGDVIVRFDAHSRPEIDYVRQAVETLDQTRAGVVGGVWQTEPGDSSLTAGAIARAVSHPMGAGDAAYRTARTGHGRQSVDSVPFGCFLKSTWEVLGGFNERIPNNEDYEFNYRSRRSGRPVMLDPAIRCTYYSRTTFGALAAQYLRYGWWKAQMLRWHPASLRWRQAVPAVLVAAIAGLGTVAALASLLRRPMVAGFALIGLVPLLLVYGAALLYAAWRISRGQRTWRIFPVLPLVFATIHFSWGGGVLLNLVTFGAWPGRFRRQAAGPLGEDS